jgi:MFS transporter, YNFM family, putative membrane transport protein
LLEPKNNEKSSEVIKILIACVITLLAVSTVFMTQPIFLEIAEYFTIDITQARFSFSIVSLFYAISFFFIGPAVDKYDLPITASIGLFLLVISIIFASQTTEFNVFVIALAFMGFCAALVPASMFPYMATIAPKNKIGLYVGSIVASATLGVIFGRVAMGVLTSFFGWRISFTIFAVIIFIFLLLTVFILVTKGDQKEKSRKNKSLLTLYKTSIKQLLNGNVFSLLSAGFSLFFGFLGMVTFLTYRLVETPFNFSAGEVGWISFAGITAIVSPFSGSISQKVGIFKIIFPSLIICLFSLQLMGWFDSVLLIVLGLLLLFLGVYSCQPLLFLLIGKNVPRESIGSASSLYILFCIGGGSLSSIFLGPIWNSYGWSGITVTCSISILISLLLMVFVKKRYER